MKNEKQSTLDIVTAKKPCEGRCKHIDGKAGGIESLNIQYDLKNIQIVAVDGAVIDVRDGGEAAILFYHTPLLKKPGLSLVRCPFEIRLSRSALLDFAEDLSTKTAAFLIEERIKDIGESLKKETPEPMFG